MSDPLKPVFKDPDGREWRIRLTVGLADRVKDETGVELGDESDSDWLALLFSRRRKCVEVMWCLCEKQAAADGITPEDFAHQFDGVTLRAAGRALAAAWADFFPGSRISQAIRTSLEAILEAGEARAVREMEAALSASLPSATNSPASSGSIPAS